MPTALFTAHLVNDGQETLTEVSEPFAVHALNYDWTGSLSDGSDLRVFAADGTTDLTAALRIGIESWDVTNKVGLCYYRVASFPPGRTIIKLQGGGSSLPAQVALANVLQYSAIDADVLANFNFDQASGTTVNSTVGGYVATTNGQWISGVGGAYGDRILPNDPAPFAGSHHFLRLNGTDGYVGIPDLWTTAGNIPLESTFAIWFRTPVAVGATGNPQIMSLTHYVNLNGNLFFNLLNRITWALPGYGAGAPASVSLSDVPTALGSTAQTSGNTIAMTASTGTLTRTVGSFTAETYAVGQTITTRGFANSANNGNFTVATVGTTTMTITPTAGLVNEGANGAVTIGSVDNRWHLITISYGAKGGELRIDGILNTYDPLGTYPPAAFTQGLDNTAPNVNVPIAAMGLGCLYDPRSTSRSNFAQIDIGPVTVWKRQLTQPEIRQHQHRLKVHAIETAYTRLKPQGAVVGPSSGGGFSNTYWEPDVHRNAGLAKFVMYTRSKVGAANSQVTRFDSTDLRNWGNISQVIGLGAGGEARSSTCPAYYDNSAVDGKYYLYWASDDGSGNVFIGMRYATSTDDVTWTSHGTIIVTAPANFLTSYAIGNISVWRENGQYNMLLECEGSGGGLGAIAQWNFVWGTSADLINWTFTGPLVGFNSSDGGWLKQPDASGPNVILKTVAGIAQRIVLMHSGVAVSTVFFRRWYGNGQRAVRNLYQQLLDLRYRQIRPYAGDVKSVQIADPCLIEYGGRIYIFCDNNLGDGTYGPLDLYTFDGTLEQLLAPSIRIELPPNVVSTSDIPPANDVLLGVSYADGTLTGTFPGVSPPSSAQATFQGQCRDSSGAASTSISVQFRRTRSGATGELVSGKWANASIDVTGLASMVMEVGDTYEVRVDGDTRAGMVTPTVAQGGMIVNLAFSLIGLS